MPDLARLVRAARNPIPFTLLGSDLRTRTLCCEDRQSVYRPAKHPSFSYRTARVPFGMLRPSHPGGPDLYANNVRTCDCCPCEPTTPAHRRSTAFSADASRLWCVMVRVLVSTQVILWFVRRTCVCDLRVRGHRADAFDFVFGRRFLFFYAVIIRLGPRTRD